MHASALFFVSQKSSHVWRGVRRRSASVLQPCSSYAFADEVGALVLDMGSALTKAGYAGEDQPKHVFPSLVGYGPDIPAPAMDTSSDSS